MDDAASAQTPTTLYHAHAPALILYARNWLSAAAAEDAVQHVFLRLLTHPSGMLTSGEHVPTLQNPRTWLFRCVRNESITLARSEARRIARHQQATQGAQPFFDPTPEDAIDAQAAQAALASLPQPQREVVTLRIWSGLTLSEISQITALPISTLHDHYRAALAALRQQLEPSCRTTTT